VLLNNSNVPHWNEIYAQATEFNSVACQAIELFGPPGDRYIMDIGGNTMCWIFKHQLDALLFKIKFSKMVC
jgi:hypothetical protein